MIATQNHPITMMMKLLTSLALACLSSCAMEAGTEYTLYRTGINVPTKTHDETLRIHVSTFDAHQDANYNLANCEFARDLFNSNQPHYRGSIFGTIKVKYWCEKGRFNK